MIFQKFENSIKVKYGISRKADGPMELANSNISSAQNRNKYFSKVGIESKKVVGADLAHGSSFKSVTNKDFGQVISSADGLITDVAGLCLSITIADCFPVYFFCPDLRKIALAHCGWRGVVLELAPKVLLGMQCGKSLVYAGIGPGVESCHFEIKADILTRFRLYPEAIIKRDGKLFVDLPLIIKKQLIERGMKPENIEHSAECTFDLKESYFSYRRDKPPEVMAMVAYIALE
jgi:polyphenol oxidase